MHPQREGSNRRQHSPSLAEPRSASKEETWATLVESSARIPHLCFRGSRLPQCWRALPRCRVEAHPRESRTITTTVRDVSAS